MRRVLLAAALGIAALCLAEAAAAQRRPMTYPGLRWGADRAQVRRVLAAEGYTRVAEDDEKGLILVTARGDTAAADFLDGRLVGVHVRRITSRSYASLVARRTREHGAPRLRLDESTHWVRGDSTVVVSYWPGSAGRVLRFSWQGPGYDTRLLGVLETRREYARKQREPAAAWVRARLDTAEWQIVRIVDDTVAVSVHRTRTAEQPDGTVRALVRWDYLRPRPTGDGAAFDARRFAQELRCRSNETRDGAGEWLLGDSVVRRADADPSAPWAHQQGVYSTEYHSVLGICGYLWARDPEA